MTRSYGAGAIEAVLSSDDPEEVVAVLARALSRGATVRRQGTLGGQALLLLPPETAQFLRARGWGRARLQQELGLAAGEVVPVARSAEEILIVVTGGIGVKATVVPTWSGGTEAVTQLVEPL